MLLELTNIGLQRESDAKIGTQAMSPIKHLVLTDTAAVTDVADIRTLTLNDLNEVDRLENIVSERVSAGTVKFHAHIKIGSAYVIRGIAVLLEDGALYAYTPYRPESGGFDKPSDLAFSLFVVHSHENSATLDFKYSPLDTESLAASAIEFVNQSIDERHQKIAAALISNSLGLLEQSIEFKSLLNEFSTFKKEILEGVSNQLAEHEEKQEVRHQKISAAIIRNTITASNES